MNIREELFEYQDLEFRQFHKKLIPPQARDSFIGVRVPLLRKLAKEFKDTDCNFEKYYYEERMLYGFIIGLKKCSVDEHKKDLDCFVKLIDNWAICDCCCSSFKFVKNNREEFYNFIVSYIGEEEYKTRFSIVMLMYYYLDDDYINRVIEIYKNIDSKYYYVNMAIAWALSVTYIKYKQKITSLLKSKTLNKDVQNKTIQKLCDSIRVSKDDKVALRKLKLN